MKNSISRKAAYIGAGAGLVLFVLFGVLPGCLLGGAAGIKLAGVLFSFPLEPGLASRTIVLASMLMGALAAGVTIVTATSSLGWMAGRVVEAAMHESGAKAGVKA
jgi:hypothetical protein